MACPGQKDRNMKFIIIGFDGLRPDMVGPQLTPNLHEFAQRYCRFLDHRCTFPSETYVNTTSLLTGTHPATHGLVANVFCSSRDGAGSWFKGYEVQSIERLQQASGGRLFKAPSVGEILGRAGMSMATISTNSAGSARLMHHQIERFNHLNLCPHSIATSSPAGWVRQITGRFTPPAERKIPDLAGVAYATDVFLDCLVPKGLPDLTCLWYGEPDNTFHMTGIGSPENQQALKHTDAQLGRVLDWWHARGRKDGIQLLIVSDHGHITIRDRVSVAGYLEQAGFKLAEHLQDGAQVAMLPQLSTNLLVKDGDAGLLTAVGQALLNADWLGSLFYNGGAYKMDNLPGALPLERALAGNGRSPHLAWTFRADEEPNRFGYAGSCLHDIGLPIGGSMHGGLHPLEMQCLLLAGGDLFKPAYRVANPTGIVDVLPTVLRGLGLKPNIAMSGRVLKEALVGIEWQPEVETEAITAKAGNYEQYLKRAKVDGRIYLTDGGRKE